MIKVKDVKKEPTYFGTLQITQSERDAVMKGIKTALDAHSAKEIKLLPESVSCLTDLLMCVNSMKKMAEEGQA